MVRLVDPHPRAVVRVVVRAAQFDICANGVLAYTVGSGTAPDYSLVWVDRAGQARPINDLLRGYEDLNLSPDGRRVALTVGCDWVCGAPHSRTTCERRLPSA